MRNKGVIDFTRAFDSAWERMLVILFRPFDLGKWFAIGLSAFLAGLLAGGNGINGSFNNDFNNLNKSGKVQMPSFNLHQFNSTIFQTFSGMQAGLVILIVAGVFLFVFAFILLFYWLGARGQFMFLDNVVRNRGAIAWPWHYYARQSNSLFALYVFFLVAGFALILPIIAVAVVVAISPYQQHRWPAGWEIAVFVILGLLYLGTCILWGSLVFIFREFGVPLMFRNGLTARAAFMKSIGLIKDHCLSVAIFVLLRIAIWIGLAILSLLVCCVTCCIEALPYIGTVILLPALVYVRCFSLDCLAQFGPQYDVWTVDVPATEPTVTPPPPLG